MLFGDYIAAFSHFGWIPEQISVLLNQVAALPTSSRRCVLSMRDCISGRVFRRCKVVQWVSLTQTGVTASGVLVCPPPERHTELQHIFFRISIVC